MKAYKASVGTFTELLGINKEHGKAYFQRAQAHQKLNNLDGAMEDYEHSILIDTENYKAYYNAGGVSFLKKDYEKAIKLFTKSIGIKSDCGDAYND
jgi:tetratricopeptide (TPR) repeat protein